MKRLNFFLISALLLFFCSSTIMAQSQKALDNRSIVKIETPWFYELPVRCNGLDDVLLGEATSTSVTHYKNGIVVGSSWRTIAEATSEDTGEVFMIRENSLTKGDRFVTFHFNAIGDQGTRYVGSMTWDMIGDPNFQNVIVHRAICPGN